MEIQTKILEELIKESGRLAGDYIDLKYTNTTDRNEACVRFLEDVILTNIDTTHLLIPDSDSASGTEELSLENAGITSLHINSQNQLVIEIIAGGDWQEPHEFTCTTSLHPATSKLIRTFSHPILVDYGADWDESNALLASFFCDEIDLYPFNLTKSSSTPSGAYQDGGYTLIKIV